MAAREEWRVRHLSALSGLSECLALEGRYSEAINTCERALTLDRYSEDLHRRLMLYRYCAGEQALSLQAFRSYAKTVKEELGATPSPELARLRTQVEDRDVPGVDTLRRYPRPRRPVRLPYSLSRMHFVGRDREYALLAERLKETMERFGGAVAVEGEAGVGKTRLVEEFLGYARSNGALVLSGRCYERELGSPLEPIMDALESVIDVAKMVSESPQPGAEERNYLREAVPYDNSRIYRVLVRKLIRQSQGTGNKALVLFVDDVQWADPATLDFLSYCAKRVSGERVLLVTTYRREDATGLSGWLDHLAERRAVTTLSLGRLSLEDTTEFLSRISSRTFGELPSLANFLQGESEGNPFYAVEYLRWLIETGAVEIDSRRRICALKNELLQESALPSGVRSLVQARISSMDDEARELLKLAAVIGRTFDLELLCKATTRGQAEALDTIEPLTSSGLVVEVPAEEEYYFSHDKLRQELYEGISGPWRRKLHLRVAEVLEEVGGESAELAHHYLRAHAWRPALENLVRAAQKAEKSYVWDSALEGYARALEVARKLPDSEQTRFELLAAQESLLERRMEGWTERAAAVQEMLELANLFEDRAQLAEAYLRRMGVLAFSDLEGATEAGRVAVEIFRELGDEAGEAQVYQKVGYARWVNCDYAGALKANFQALRLHRTIGNRRDEANDLANMAQIYRYMGNYGQALRCAEEAARNYQELGNKLGEAWAISIMAGIHREREDPEAALPLALKALEFFTELGNRRSKFGMVSLHNACGTLYLDLGAPEKALEHFRAAVHLSQERGQVANEVNALMSVGVSLEQVGNFAGAADAYRRAIELLETDYEVSGMPEELSIEADTLTLLGGVLHHSLDEPVEAIKAYEAATEIYRELNDAHRLRKPLLGLAGLRWRMGSLEGSAHGYEEALNLARDHGETAHEATALASLSVVYRDLGRFKEALRCGREALRPLRELGDLQAEAYVLSSLAESHGKLGHYPSALSCLRRSLRLRRKVGDKEGEVGVLYDLARIYENLGDTDRGRACSVEAALKKGTLEQAQLALGAERRN